MKRFSIQSLVVLLLQLLPLICYAQGGGLGAGVSALSYMILSGIIVFLGPVIVVTNIQVYSKQSKKKASVFDVILSVVLLIVSLLGIWVNVDLAIPLLGCLVGIVSIVHLTSNKARVTTDDTVLDDMEDI